MGSMKSVDEIRSLLLTPETMRAEGLDARNPARLVARKVLSRLRRGVYIRTRDAEALRHEEIGVLRVLAYAVAARVPPVFCRESAALLHGLSFRTLPRRIHVVGRTSHGHGSADVAVHRRSADGCVDVAGVRATGLEDTLVDCAHGMPRDEALVVLESALWADRRAEEDSAARAEPIPEGTTLEQRVRSRIAESSVSGKRAAALLLPLMTSCSESPGETLAKSVLHDAGFAAPEQQFRIGPYRVDFAWPGARVILEFDGMVKYSDDARAARAIRAERRRQLELNRAGWTVVRTDWAEVVNTPWVLVQKLRSAGVPEIAR